MMSVSHICTECQVRHQILDVQRGERETERERETDRDRETDRQRQKETDRERERELCVCGRMT